MTAKRQNHFELSLLCGQDEQRVMEALPADVANDTGCRSRKSVVNIKMYSDSVRGSQSTIRIGIGQYL